MTQFEKATRLSKLAIEFNVGVTTLVDYLKKKGHDVDQSPNSKVAPELCELIAKEYGKDANIRDASKKLSLKNLREKKETISLSDMDDDARDDADSSDGDDVFVKVTSESPIEKKEKREDVVSHQPVKDIEVKVVGKIDLDSMSGKQKKQEEPVAPVAKAAPVVEAKPEPEVVPAPPVKEEKAEPAPVVEIPREEIAVKVVGKIDLDQNHKKPADSAQPQDNKPKHKPAEGHKQETPKPEGQEHKKQDKPHEKHQDKPQANRPEHHKPKQEPVVAQEPVAPEAKPAVEPVELYRSAVEKLSGPTVVGKIDLDAIQPKKKPVASSSDFDKKKKKRKRIKKDGQNKPVTEGGAPKPANQPDQKAKVPTSSGPLRFVKKDNRERNAAGTPLVPGPHSDKNKGGKKKPVLRQEVNEVDVQKQIKDTLARLTGNKGKSKGSKYRREKRDLVSQRHMAEQEQADMEKNIIKITEFVSVSELASMMDVPVTDVIETCMNMGLMVSINQRLDAETLALVADEFNYKVEFVSIEIQEAIKSEEDSPEDLISRPPIVTVMGHVDHGKTSLLDHIRHANVIAGEAGGITQHIGAYSVTLEDGRVITFLDTPGHEAFTAMRARGAKLTDVAIIVIAADDSIMPQTVEAINHASAAGVPIVFAINKIDKPGANPEKIKEALAGMNYLVEDWGGKYQCQEISAKKGTNMELLLEKVLLEAELLELKANPNKKAIGGVIESSLDKGRGYMTTVLVEAGTLRIGDFVLAGTHTGRVKAMFNERNKRITEAGPSTPVLVLGLNGAPQAGDRFNILDTEKEAKEIATKREQLLRLQGLRSQKHITLDEIGRRIAIGNFQEINIIVKGDVDGSVEALTDSLVKLSTPEIQVNVIHKGVGQISESDVLLADASNAIVIGFQVRPSAGARRLAEKEGIDIRHYSIIYDAINELKAAMEGMLSPDFKEEIVASLEVMEVFNITKVGTVAGCIVREGKILRNTKIRVIRDGIVVHTGELGSLKRFKDDVKDVATGYECGLNINKFNDLQVGDVIEGYDMVEVKKKL